MALPDKKVIQLEFGADTKPLEQQLDELKAKFKSFHDAISTKQEKSDFLSTLELQAKAGIIPLAKLRDEITQTVRTAIAAKGTRAEFVNDQDILKNIIRLQQLKKEMQGVTAETETFQSKISKIGSALQQAFLPLAGISAGITALLGTSAKSFADFERTLNTIKAVSDLTVGELETIKQSSLDLGQKTIFSNQQVATSYLELSKAGFTAKESLQTMPGLLNLAAAAGGDLGIATQAVTEGMRAFGLQAKDTARFTDVLAQAANQSSVDIGDMVTAFRQVAPVAAQAKQPIEDVSALLAILGNNGVKGGDAGSDLRNIITRLSSPNSKEALNILKQLNVSLTDQQGNVKKLSVFFKELQTALSKYNDKGRLAAATQLVGQENLKSFLILAGQAPATIDAMVASMDNATGATQRMADTINQGLFSSLEQLSGSFDTLKTTLGEALAPAIKAVAQALTQLNSAASQNKTLTQFAAGALAALAAITALGAAVGGLLLVLAPLGAAFAALGISLPVVGIALVGLIAAAGLLTVAMNSVSESNQLAKRSVQDLHKEIDNAADSALKATEGDQKLAKSLDELKKKTTLTKDEQKLLVAQFNELKKSFPELNGSMDELIKKYGSLEAAIKNVRIQQAALQLGKSIDDQLSTVRDSLSKFESGQSAVFSLNTRTRQKFFSPEDQKSIDNLKKQEADLVSQRENLSQRLVKMFKEEDKAANGTSNSGKNGGKNLNTADPDKAKQAADKIVKAEQQLKDKILQIDIELTAASNGETAKRLQESLRQYQKDIQEIQERGKEAKATQEEINNGLDDAFSAYLKRNQDIQNERNKTFRENERLLNSLKSDIGVTLASISQGNPFDDIEADVKKATTAINIQYSEALERLAELQKQKLIPENLLNDLKAAYEKRKDADKELAVQAGNERLKQEKESLLQLKAQNDILVAELSNNQVDIIKANYKKAQDEISRNITETQKKLKDQLSAIDKTRASLNDARANVLFDPSEASKAQEQTLRIQLQGQERARDLLTQQLKNSSSQQFLSLSEELKALQEQDTANAERRIQELQREIDLYGQRPDKVRELISANEDYIKQLEKESDLNSGNDAKLADIAAKIQEIRKANAALSTSTDTTGRVLNSLKSINFGGEFGSVFQNLISGFEQFRVKFALFQKDTQNAGKGLKDFIKGNQSVKDSLASLGSQFAQTLGDSIFKGKSGITKALGSTLTGAASGALAGLSAGPIGAAIGGLVGAVSGAASSSGGKFSAKAGLIGLPFGLIGFGIAGLIGGAKKAADAAKQLKKTQNFMQDILAKADQNDLTSLQSSLSQVLKFKSGGGAAFQAKSQAAQQLQQAIKARSDVIAQAVKDLQFQNSALAKQLQEFDSLPFENLNLERQINLDQLTSDRDTALLQFKDSLQVQQDIQQNFELKRQALLKQSSQDIIDTVIDEQNKIRTLRAQTAVNDAKTSGDALNVINAELQARLVAIDNDIASFKGAEEEKTEFLKEKASERNSIIKDANNQVSDLLQQGLDILNQGLVLGQTKAQSQQSQLKKLFGNLNPLGLIQADGNLVQSNVTVGAGAFQFILQGIQDAQGLIAQLQDPLVQAAVQSALNTAVART
jgi:TP901 family phage tail tape measure protein